MVTFCNFCYCNIEYATGLYRAKTINSEWICDFCYDCYDIKKKKPKLASGWIKYIKPSVILTA